MKTILSPTLRGLCLASAIPAVLHAAALAIPEQSAESLGIAASGVARSASASNVFDNPAGLARLDGTALLGGSLFINPSHTYRGDDGRAEAESSWYVVPHAYVAHGLDNGWAFGLGVYVPFGLGTEWDDDWQGRYVSTSAQLQTVVINPSAAYRVNDSFSVGAGIRYFIADADIKRKVDAGLAIYGASGANPGLAGLVADPDLDTEFGIKGDGDAFGFDLGAQWRVHEQVDLGLHVVSGVTLDFDGTARFTHSAATQGIGLGGGMTALDVLSAVMPASQGGSTSLELPWIVQFGGLYRIDERWDLSVGFDYNAWSSYEELVVHLDDELPADRLVSAKDWNDAFTIRAGATCQLAPEWLLRFGALYDSTPVASSSYDGQLPDGDRVAGSLGLGWRRNNFQIDLAYMYVRIDERSKANLVGYQDVTGDGAVSEADKQALDALAGGLYPVGQGSYDGDVHLIALSVGGTF